MLKRAILYIGITMGLINGIILIDHQTPEPTPAPPTPLPTGQFMTAPARITRLEPELWVLEEDFVFIDSFGKEWVAPAGTRTDGASIPQAFLSVVGDKFNPAFLDAAVVHDAYCGSENAGGPSYQAASWQYVHYMFYEALLTSGVPEEKAKIMFTAVYMGGPRWGEDADQNILGRSNGELTTVVTDETVAEFEEMVNWIETDNPTPEEILAQLEESNS